jgi:hypothetical protein
MNISRFATRAGLAGAAVALAAVGFAGQAHASTATAPAAAASTYSLSYIDRCADTNNSYYNCLELGTYATYTSSQIWKNGNVFCYNYAGNVQVTWCGVGGGNGTATLNIGANFNVAGHNGFYERMNISAGGGGCSTWGSNSNTNGITSWYNDGPVVCKQAA